MRRLSGNDPEVNEEWITDKDRFAFHYATAPDRITYPQVRDDDGSLRPASWPEAFAVAARGLADAGASAVLTGGRVTAEDAYAYSKFARVALETNDIDFRARPLSAEEASFLAGEVVLRQAATYADLDAATTVVLAGLEPEDEAGTLFLRLRKATQRGRAPLRVVSIAPFTSRGLHKLGGQLLATRPGGEAAALESLLGHGDYGVDTTAVILVGERLATSPGALSAAATLAAKTGAKLAWVPRRAGDRGAVETGCLPGLLPGGRPVVDAVARVDAGATWGVDALPETVGRDADQIVAALAAGELGGLVVGGVDPDDTADPGAFRAALDAASFVVSLELRETDVTRVADVVFPVAPVSDKAGMFVTWEGRPRTFEAVFTSPSSLPDLRILAGIAEELGHPLGFRTVAEARAEMEEMGPWDGERAVHDAADWTDHDVSDPGVTLLASWKQLIDLGSMQDGDDNLRATARMPVARVSATMYDALGPSVTVTGDRGSVTLPAVIADLPDGVVWLPGNSTGRGLLADVGVPGSCRDPEGSGMITLLAAAPPIDNPDLSRLRPRPVVADHHQGRADLRGPGPAHALQHLVGAPGRRPHAAPHRPQRERPLRPAAVAGRRREAGAEGRHHPQGRRQVGVPARARDRHGAGVHHLRGDPLRAGRRRAVQRRHHAAAADRPAGGGAVRDGRRRDRHLRHRARRLVQRVDVLAPRRAALQRADDLLRGRHGPRARRRLPLRRLAVDLARSWPPRTTCGSA